VPDIPLFYFIRNNCTYVTLGTCYSVWMTVWYAPAYNGHPHRITSAKSCINTVVSPDDEHMVAQNM